MFPAHVGDRTFFETASNWNTFPPAAPPADSASVEWVETAGRRHPRRPPKPRGTVYRRRIPWLERTLSFRVVDIDRDVARFNRWMNDPRVAFFWEEAGDMARHRAYLEAIAADPRVIGLIGCLDDAPFAYFEVYWAKEDRIAPFCDASDHDRGWHALVGEEACRGRAFVSAWMPGISHHLFLDDPRTERLVIEPRVDNDAMRRSLVTSGYRHIRDFDFPHKRAALHVLSRGDFFNQRRWLPRDPVAAPPSRP